MSKYCSDCTYLNIYNCKGKGYVQCEKKGFYVNTNREACDEFSNAYARSWYEKEKIYEEGKEYESSKYSDESPSFYVVVFLVLLLLSYFLKI